MRLQALLYTNTHVDLVNVSERGGGVWGPPPDFFCDLNGVKSCNSRQVKYENARS